MTAARTTLVMLGFLLLVPRGHVLAQQIPFDLPDFTEQAAERPVETRILAAPEPRRPGTAFLGDRMVDRSTYVAGPNDRLSIAIMGYSDAFYEVEVSADGNLLIPKIGNVPVAGLALDDVEARIRARARRVYPEAEVALTLTRPRVFKVYLLGDVPAPGPRAASPLTRVSELLEEGGSEPRQIRNVDLVRASGDTVSVDLVRFRQTGDLRFNPTLREGDVAIVPGRDESVEIYGRVFFPGPYEYRRGETLAEILRIANGERAFPSDAHDVIEVTRFTGPSERTFFTFRRDEALGERGRSFALEPFDAIYVPAVTDFKVQKTVDVEGEVRYPGTYPIRPDTTTVRDLVRMAGGLTPEASLASARLVRREIGTEDEAMRTLQEVPPEFLTEEELRIMRIQQTAEPNRVVIDFVDLLGSGESPATVTLDEGDRLVIPRERKGVTVLGAVLDAGIVAFEPGAPIDTYVARAGGYTERADEGDVIVLKARQGTRLQADEVAAIESGDTIIVPYEEERDLWEIYRTAATVTTGVLSVVLSFIAATR